MAELPDMKTAITSHLVKENKQREVMKKLFNEFMDRVEQQEIKCQTIEFFVKGIFKPPKDCTIPLFRKAELKNEFSIK